MFKDRGWNSSDEYESAFGTLMHPMVTMSTNIPHVVNIIISIHYVVVLSIFSSILEIQQKLASHLVGSKKDAWDLLVQYGVGWEGDIDEHKATFNDDDDGGGDDDDEHDEDDDEGDDENDDDDHDEDVD